MASECMCPNITFVQAMLSYLAQTDSHFGSVQRGGESLSQVKKEEYLHSVLHQSASTFIARYGDKMTEIHRAYFRSNFSNDKDLMYQLALLKKEEDKLLQRVKNRRFTAMKKMMAEGDYFQDEQMKQRDPLLYEQMVGKLLTDEEIQTQSDNLLRQHTGFSTLLMEQMDSKDNAEEYERRMCSEEGQLEESDGDESMSEGDVEGESAVADDERVALREEFLHTMQERFLSGFDKDFNYESVDADDTYDDIAQESRDAEEKYFDASDEEATTTEPSLLPADGYDY